ncbi:MAG: hypothetical protein ACTSRS_18125 [Candidatus Helarchaeota archaeon]
MSKYKPIKLLFKLLVLVYFLPLLFGAFAFSHLFQRLLRNALREKGRDEIIRLLSYKGAFGIFDLLGRRLER